MAAPLTVQNPAASTDSKSAKKRKAKIAERTESPAPTVSPSPEKAAEGAAEDGIDNAYVRELQK